MSDISPIGETEGYADKAIAEAMAEVVIPEGIEPTPLLKSLLTLKSLVDAHYGSQKWNWRFKVEPIRKLVDSLVRKVQDYEPPANLTSTAIAQQDQANQLLRARLDAIDREDLPEDERRAKKLKYALGSIDPMKFIESMERGLEADEPDARKLYAQVSGLLKDREEAVSAPVFHINFTNVRAVSDESGKVIDVQCVPQITSG